MRIVMVAVIAAGLGGCAAQASKPADEADKLIIGRVDCQPQEGNPVLQQELTVAKAICENQANAASVAASSAVPTGSGIGGAIASGIQAGIAGASVANSTALACMAERGYLVRTLRQHEEACVAIRAHQNAAAASRKKR